MEQQVKPAARPIAPPPSRIPVEKKPLFNYRYMFMCPAFEFGSRKQAHDYGDGRNVSFEHDIDPRLFADNASFVQNGYLAELDTHVLPQARSAIKTGWHMIRQKKTPRPNGSRNTCLIYEGPSKAFINMKVTDCYAVWQVPFSPIWRDGERKMFSAKRGKGVLYARVLRYNEETAQPYSLDTHMIALEYGIYDRDPNRDDMLKLTVHAQGWTSSPDISKPREVTVSESVLPVFRQLIDRARVGFEQHCKPIDPEIERLIIARHDQRVKYGKAFDRYHASSRVKGKADLITRLRRLPTQKVLDWVKEPWQLRIAIDAHSGKTEFMLHPPHCSGSISDHVINMLKAYDCPKERKDLLWKWVSDFVEPAYGRQWLYTGD